MLILMQDYGIFTKVTVLQELMKKKKKNEKKKGAEKTKAGS